MKNNRRDSFHALLSVSMFVFFSLLIPGLLDGKHTNILLFIVFACLFFFAIITIL